MRLAVVLNLVGLVLLCPFVCGAAESDQGAHRHQPVQCSDEGPSTPVHCPDEGTSCLCQGAVRSVEARSNGFEMADPVTFGTLHFDLFPSLPSNLLAHLTHDGRSTGIGSRGDALTVRALLQNYRC